MKRQSTKLKRAFNLKYIITLSIFALTGFCSHAQTTDSLPKPSKEFKNSIKLNATMILIYDKAIQFGYERVVKKNQTINIAVGYQEFPFNLSLPTLPNTALGRAKNKSGYSFGVDYRFYLSKENKYDAPHGVYLAPYVTFYHFSTDKTLSHTDTSGTQSSTTLKTRMGFTNIGAELGYQFVLGKKKRWVIDAVVFGPAVSHYYFNAKLQSKLPGLDENEALQKVIAALKEKLPLLDRISNDEGVSASGINTFWSVGFRYNISIGFRF